MASHGGSAAFDSYTSSRSDGKRKFDDPPEPNRRGSENNRVSYNSVPPPLSDFELAKQRAQQIAARLVAQDTKRTRTDGTSDDTAGRTSSNEQHHVVRNRDESHDSESRYDSLLDSIQFRKLEIPNTKVGLIIGRGGETIKYLQQQSGAKIQVARDADTDVNSLTRNIELTGFPDQLSRAEQLIKDVMAEADARGPTAPSFIQGGELLHLRIPSNKVGLVIGRGGETIRSLQSKSGAHIQLVPLQGEEARFGVSERTLTLTGSKEQIQVANDMIMEMISEYRNRPPPPPMSSGGYHQQQPFHLPGPPGQWGPPGPSLAQQGYGYQQPAQYRGPPQYLPPPPPLPPQYGGHSQQASTDFGWNQPQFGPNQPQHNYYNQQSQPAGSPYASQSGDYIQEGPYTQQGYSQQGSNTEQFYGQQGYSQVSYASGSIQDYGPPGTNYNQLNDSEQPGYGQQASTPQDYGHQMNYGQQESVHQSSVPSGYTQQEAMTQMYVQKNSSEQSQGNNELTNQAYSSSGYNDQPYGGHQPSHESHGQQESKQQDFEQLESSQSGYLQQSLSEGYKQQNTVEYAQQGSNQPGYGGQSSLPKSYTGQPVQGASHSNYVQLSARQQGFSSQSFVNQESGQSAFGTRSHQDSPSHGHEVVQPGYGSRGTGQQGSSHQSYPSKGPEPDYEQQISTQYTSGQGHEVTHGQHPYPEKYGYACTPQTSTYEGQQDSYYHQPNDQAGGGIDGEYNNTNASEG